MAKDTKDRILEAALEIFARDGYAGTNIKEIAEAVGIVKSALYRHFESKEEIWIAVQNMMVDYYNEHFGSPEKLPLSPKNTDELWKMTFRMINFTLHDRKVVMMRRILLTEQFRDERIRKLASTYFVYDTEEIFTKVFEEMMKNGSLKKADPGILAFSYTSPISALIQLCDREPEKETEVMEKMQRFVKHFIEEYGEKKNEK